MAYSYFKWKGVNHKGRKRKGEYEAADEKQVESYLKRLRISEFTIKEKPKDLFENVSFMQQRVKPKDVMVFTRQFSTMIDAGLPLIQCIKIMADQSENKTFKKALRDINDQVQSGGTLSDALRRYPKLFDDLYCNLIAAGETAGILDSILERLAQYIERAEQLKNKVKGAMMYPAVVMLVALAVVTVILVFVIPVFEDIFKSFGRELPGPTQIVVNISHTLRENFLMVGGAFILLIIVFLKLKKMPPVKYVLDKFILHIPVVGDLARKVSVSRFSRTLATMLQAGVPIIVSLDVVGRTSGNLVVEEAIFDSRAAISEGRPLTDPLIESQVFPAMVTQMIGVGEESGSLDVMLLKIADFYDEEVNTAVDALTTLIEPLLIVFLGTIVGGIVIAMYLPIFEMAGAM